MSGVEFAAETPASPPAPPGPPADPASAPEPPAESAPRERLGRRSLTSRLVLGVGSLAVVLILIIGGGTFFALRYFLTQRLDDQVQSTASGSLTELFGAARVPDPGVAPTDVWAVALDTSGKVLTYPNTSAQWIHRLRLSASDARMLSQDAVNAASSGAATSIVSITTVQGTSLRAIARTVPATNRSTGEVQQAVAIVGLSTQEEHRVLKRLLGIEIIIGGFAVALALIMTYAGVRFSLRGLRRVSTTAQEVAAELSPSGAALQRRVPVSEEGTEVAQLTESFNTLLQSAETQFAARVESEERMRQFLADASHELRTPLTSIRGYAELARMQRAAGRQDEDNLDRIEAEGTRMSRLVEDLLILARGGSGAEPVREVIDVGGLLGDAVSGVRAAFADRVIDEDAMVPMRVLGDPDQLLRVVRNLLTNAVVHTRPGPHIRIRAFRWDDPAPGVVIQVIDGGPGLAPEEAAHVFERFWRADKARSRARGGSGLGLSIVASIIAAHGGTVRFDSSVEVGSTVTVWLPAAPEHP